MSQINWNIPSGTTFTRVFRWAAPPLIYKPVTAVVSLAPLRLTVVGHGMVTGVRAALSDFKGMVGANASSLPPRQSDYKKVVVLDADTLEFNDIDASGFGTYASGGFVSYFTPTPLTGYTAALEFRAQPDLTLPALLSLTTANGGIVIDAAAQTITVTITLTQLLTLSFTYATFDLEMLSPGGVRSNIAGGIASITPRSTT